MGFLSKFKVWKGFKDVRATIIVDVTKPEEEIISRMDRSRRKNVNKAIREGVLFTEAKDGEWPEWYKIYCKVWKEGGVSPSKLDFLKKPNYKLYLAKKDDCILGGGLFEEAEDRIIFRAYASLIEYQELRVNDFLYWSSILWAKKNGKKEVDLGGWQINARDHLKGVNEFKEKWGGNIVNYEVCSKNPFYIIGRKLIKKYAFFWWLNKKIRRRK